MGFFRFDEDTESFVLLNKHNKEIADVHWDSEPELLSGVFVINGTDVYTVLGDKIKGLDANYVKTIINFWIIYYRDNDLYIAKLEPIGLKFKVKAETMVEEIGYLTYDGCVVKQNGEWKIYNYSFGCLTEDNTVPSVSIDINKIDKLLKKGFTTEYLAYLSEDVVTKAAIMNHDTYKEWEKTNKDFIEVIKKLSELTDTYDAERIGDVIGLKKYIVSVIMQYLEIKNFINDSKDNNV